MRHTKTLNERRKGRPVERIALATGIPYARCYKHHHGRCPSFQDGLAYAEYYGVNPKLILKEFLDE